jgi:hypothetical protein
MRRSLGRQQQPDVVDFVIIMILSATAFGECKLALQATGVHSMGG